jgi:starch-binding outer membrane protein, SusD/RagB family
LIFNILKDTIMKNKIFLFLIGCLFLASCSEDFITKDNDKSRYTPGTFFTTKASANQALNAAYSGLNAWGNGYTWFLGLMNYVLGDDLYETGNAAGFAPWGAVTNFDITNTQSAVADTWNGYYQDILLVNNALDVMPAAQKVAEDVTFTTDVLNLYMGQAYFLRAFMYYNIAQYFGDDKVIIRKEVPKTPADYALAPATADEAFAFIESDLKKAEELLVNGLNTTSGYDAGRVTRGAAAALLGKWYINHGLYDKAAAEFKKILPGIGDAAYGTYSLTENYRDNFTIAAENNSESVFEIQFKNLISQPGWSNNDVHWLIQNFTTNRTANPDMWWNWAVPTFKLNDFESWTEDINGTPTTVYDYRAYETFWGVPNGAEFTYKGTVKDWVAQGWDKETIVGLSGAYGIRKYAYDNTDDRGFDPAWNDVNLRMIRLADVMLLYAECLANTGDNNGALTWIDKVRDRANNVATDQAHLYSARTGVKGKLPSASALMAAKGWSLLQLIQHERYVEGYCEGWRKEDMKRWKVGADFVQHKSGFKGYKSLTLPVPQDELDRNPMMPK